MLKYWVSLQITLTVKFGESLRLDCLGFLVTDKTRVKVNRNLKRLVLLWKDICSRSDQSNCFPPPRSVFPFWVVCSYTDHVSCGKLKKNAVNCWSLAAWTVLKWAQRFCYEQVKWSKWAGSTSCFQTLWIPAWILINVQHAYRQSFVTYTYSSRVFRPTPVSIWRFHKLSGTASWKWRCQTFSFK